ncbi:V-type ATP synthase subunit F [Candidatus Hecatella orcuttiae]|uniref:V-type ATP synthase subunit F n=1 Tax=Candidatus Hecatella orcuttiae TaxID=1935119 RepID=UPI00286832DE|nr:V-type ATP synthase subunit F [Candidatus Hecatella orcuttiae]
MAKIAVVADPDVASYFRVTGVKKAYGVKTAKEAAEALRKLAGEKEVAVIIVTEKIAEEIKPVIEEVGKRVYPTVITIPGKEGPIPGKVPSVMDLVKRTVGVEIKL